MNKNISERIDFLPTHCAIKDVLSHESAERNLAFYLNLFNYLIPAFKSVDTEAKENLAFGGYLYFRFLLLFDNFLDSDEKNSLKMAHSLSILLDLHELAIKELSNVFEKDSIFWSELNKRKEEYKCAVFKEKELSKARQNISEENFLDLAIGKSAISYVAIDALIFLGKSNPHQQELQSCLENIHIAFQYLDDIEDFKKDYFEEQWTYTHFLVSEYMIERNIKVDDIVSKHKYLFVSGIAHKLLEEAVKHYQNALDVAEALNLEDLKVYLSKQISHVTFYSKEISLLIEKTSQKAKKSHILIKNNTLDLAITSNLKYLTDNLQNNVWVDFMTSAGKGETWISGFVGLMLFEIGFDRDILNNVLSNINNEGSFNPHIIEDADSTNFLVAFYNQMNETPKGLLERWLEFQTEKGGWKTYKNDVLLTKMLNLEEGIDVGGWTQNHPCVSAVSALVLSRLPEQQLQFDLTCKYLANLLHNDALKSYWWTSDIYTWSFTLKTFADIPVYQREAETLAKKIIDEQCCEGYWKNPTDNTANALYTALALQSMLTYQPQEYEYEIKKGINWLVKNQMNDGSWKTNRILRIPATNVKDPTLVTRWRNSSFGVNCLVDDYNRVFTASAVANVLNNFRNAN